MVWLDKYTKFVNKAKQQYTEVGAHKIFYKMERIKMIIGLDMGGTHTDVALLENGEIYKKTKYPRQEDFLESILIPLDQIMEGEDPSAIERVLLSTTLSTNAIVEGKLGKVGMVLEPGPGLNLDYLNSIFPFVL